MSSETADTIRILIADDHPVVRAGLASMLATYPDIEVAGSVSDGRQAVAMLEKTAVSLLLLDLRMPALNGIETLRVLGQVKSPPRVIVLTSYESDEDIYQTIRSGAHGYLLKASSEEEMIEAIHVVHAGQRYFPRHIMARFARLVPRVHLDRHQTEIFDSIAQGMAELQIAEILGISVIEVREKINTVMDMLNATKDFEATPAPSAPRTTIADIARKAGVSMATVSRVLHNKGKHTEETRSVVMKVVREYDFQLNDTAASLAQMRNPSSQD